MAQTPTLAIIVISYNTREMTLACLASVVAETRLPYELIVVDNASNDGSAEAIAAAYPDIRLIAETENHGFGPAHDIALRETNAPWILLLNPDTVVLDGAIDALMAFAERTPDAGIWGGRTLYGDRSLNPTSCFARMTLWSVFCRVVGLNGMLRSSTLFNSEYYGTWARDSERAVDIVTGCLFLIRRTEWDRLGGFDPDFTMYGEEVDLCLRGRAIGLRPRVTPEATIIHYGGASQAVRADKMVRLMKAKTELIKRHFHPATRGMGQWLFARWPLSRAAAFQFAARLTRRAEWKEQATIWAEIWSRRTEWQNGYSAPK
ncbi:MAG: glycosyltransferase family 2 protein [Pseudomonadota bacterium]